MAKKKKAKLYIVTYKLRKGTKHHNKYEWASTAKIAKNKHNSKFGKSHVILKVKLS